MYVKWEIVFFNLQKLCIVERISRRKGVTLEVKLVGRFKVFGETVVLQNIYFCESLVHIKNKMVDFKIALLEILKQRVKQWKSTNKALKNLKNCL